ncbi:MAG: DUF11 domain-containing protein [Desulfobacterales bacterium]|nr:DUF11 domain-containing protein [Desulfobacterales bacterium]
MKRHDRANGTVLLLLTAIVIFMSAGVVHAAVFGGYSEYYIPGREEQMWHVFNDIARRAGGTINSGPGMHSVISITSPGEGSTVYYDHWEDGYEFDPADPENTYDEKHVLAAGEVLRRESSNIPVPNRGTNTYYDGGDRLYVAGTSAAVSRTSWTEDQGTILAISWELLPVKPFLTDYTIPVGENLAGQYEDFERVYVIVQSVSDNNVVQIDNGGDGSMEVVTTLDKGGTTGYPVLPGATLPVATTADSGTHVKGQYPIQVHFIVAGYSHGMYESRGYNAMPDSMWDNEYINPVGGSPDNVYEPTAGTTYHPKTDLYLYNPQTTDIIINYEDTTSSGTFTIASRSTKSYFDGTGENGGVSHYVPQNSGVSLRSDNIFWGIGSFDTESTTYDWGYSLVPRSFLTKEYFLSWAPGTSDIPPTANGSPAHVTAVYDDTVVFVDYSPTDGTPDETVTMSHLESRKFFDTDNDNTGMHIWATGPLAVAWGQDPVPSTPYDPYMDLGTANLPMPKDWIDLTLGIKKTADPTVIAPVTGRTTTFTLQVKTYAFPVKNISVYDVLPDGFSFVDLSARITLPDGNLILNAAANPAISGQELTWSNTVLNMAPNKTLTIAFDAVIDNTVTVDTYSNTARASGTRLEGSQVFSPFDSIAINVTAVTIDKDTTTPTVSAGGTAAYTIRVKNISDTDATNLSVTDILPDGFSYAGTLASIVFYDALGNEDSSTTATNDGTWGGTWSLGPGESVAITFTAVAGAGIAPDTYDSTASAQFDWGGSTDTIDDLGEVAQDLGTPSGEDPEDDEDVTITSLLINKTTSTPTVGAGGTATYTIRLENSGAANVTGVTVSDALPGGFTFASGSVTQNSATRTSTTNPETDDTSLAWGTWTINSGGWVEIAFIVNVPDGTTPGTYDNSALADSDQTGLIDDAGAVGGDAHTLAADTEDDEDVTVETAVLTIDKDAPFPYAAPGGPATYTITVANAGSATATGVSVTDSLAAGFAYDAAAADIVFYDALGNVTSSTTATNNGSWGGGWTLAPGASVKITFKTIANGAGGTYDSDASAAAAGGISVDDVGTVGYDADTPSLADPEEDEDITVLTTAMADLAVEKSHTGDFDLTGPNSYTIKVTNNGPYTETNTVTVTDSLPAGLDYFFVDNNSLEDNWACQGTDVSGPGPVTCTRTYTGLDSLAVGASTFFTLTVRVDESAITTPVTNSVSVTSPTSDLIAGNDIDTDETAVLYSDLSQSTKTVLDLNGGDVEPGDALRYTIRLTESAGLDADAVSVTDDIPADVTGFSAALVVVRDSSGVALVPVPVNSSTDTGGANGTGYLDITGIDVPANDYVEIVFTVAVDAGAGQGTLIDNAAIVANPDGPDKTVNAPQLVVQLSQIPAQGEKPLYLFGNQNLSRAVPSAPQATVAIPDRQSRTWTLTPNPVQAVTIDTSAGAIPVTLTLRDGYDFTWEPPETFNITMTLSSSVDGTIATHTETGLDLTNHTDVTRTYNLAVDGGFGGIISSGAAVTLTIDYDWSTYPDDLDVFSIAVDGTLSQVIPRAETVINVDNVAFYDDAYPAGSAITNVLPGNTVYVRATVSDPFGAADITGATVDLVDPEGTVVVDDEAMTAVTTTGIHPKIFETSVTIPSDGAANYWTATVTAIEGSEGTVTDAGVGTILVTSVIGADLAITKFHSDTFFENHTARFTLRVTNYGPEDQVDPVDPVDPVVVTDVLPAGLTYVSSTGTDWTLTGNASDTPGAGQTTLEWTYGGTFPIAAGTTLPAITLTVRTDAGAPTSMVNTASVSIGQGTTDPENNPGNNSSTDTVYPVVQSVVKTVDREIHYYGDNSDTLTYTITVTNTGAGEMTNVVVTDELPVGTTYVAGTSQVSGPAPALRVTEYYVPNAGPDGFTGTSYELVLDKDLKDNYFVIVQGSDGDGATRGPDENYVSLTADPFATGDLSASGGSDRLGFVRHNNVNGWRGVITVVESMADHGGSGFYLRNVARVFHGAGDTGIPGGVDTIATPWTEINQVMLLGGVNGSGCDVNSATSAHHNSCHVRLWPTGTNTINWTRNGPNLQDATSTVMAVEWGSDWTIQRRPVSGGNGGAGVNRESEYNLATIDPVNRQNTWVWGTGHTNDIEIREAAEGVVLTIGNDFSGSDLDAPNTEETQLAAGIERSGNEVDFEVYALTHADLAVDHRFKADGDSVATTYNQTVDAATGNRMALITNGSNGGNGETTYPRPIWSAQYTANDNILLERRYSGQDWPAWVQGIDFSGITGGVQTADGGDPPNLVTAADDYSLQPGETLTVTFSVTVDDPSVPATLVNTVFVTSDGGTVPVASSATTVVRTKGIPEFTDVDGNAKTPGESYDLSQEQIYLKLYDPDRNTDPSVRETVMVTVTNPDTGDSETYTLYETGLDTGDFAYAHPVIQSPESNTDPNAVETVQWNITNPETELIETITLTETGPNTGIFENNDVWIRHILPLTDEAGSSGDGLLYLEPDTDPDLEIAYADPADPDRDNATAFAAVATRAVIAAFGAVADGGEVMVVWETSSEMKTLGFYLERLNPATGQFERIGSRLMPGLLTAPQGGTYWHRDSGATTGETYTYRLIEIEAPGREIVLGPYTVTVDNPEDLHDVPAFDGDFFRAPHPPNALPAAQPMMMALSMAPLAEETGDVLKVSVTEDGLVTVTASVLAAKFDRDVSALIEAGGLSVTLEGEPVRYMAAADNSAIFFYGQAPDSVYTAENVYWVTEGSGVMLPLSPANSDLDGDGSAGLSDARAALQIMVGLWPAAVPEGHPVAGADIDGDGKIGPAEALYALQGEAGLRGGAGAGSLMVTEADTGYFLHMAHFEQDIDSITDWVDDPHSDYWIWATLLAGSPAFDTLTHPFTVHDLAEGGGEVRIEVHLQSIGDTANQVQVALNGDVIADQGWDGARSYDLTAVVDSALLLSGNEANILAVSALPPSGEIFVDSFDLTYSRRFKAVDDRLDFTPDDNLEVTVSGFIGSDIYVFDVTDPARPMQVADAVVSAGAGGFQVRFTPTSSNARYLATTLAGAAAPAAVAVDTPSTLADAAKEGEYLIITPKEFQYATPEALMEAVQTLADYRRGQGLSVYVAFLEDIMDEFNHGIFSPEAIRTFLRYARDNWATAPRYVVLVGEGSYDYKDIYGKAYDYPGLNYMPPVMVATPEGLFGSDNWLADLDGDDNVPEVAIGRLPAITVAELTMLIDKIVAYETQGPADWQKRILLAADNQDGIGGDFSSDSDTVAAFVPDRYATEKIYQDDLTNAQARNALITNGIDAGALLVNFIGHGGYETMTEDPVLLSSSDIASLTNADKLAVVSAFSCVLGRFDFWSGLDGISEQLLMQPGGGAVAVFSSSGHSMNAKARLLNEEFFRALFVDGKTTLGDAVVQALQRYRQRTGDTLVPRTYNLLGDPALRMPLD